VNSLLIVEDSPPMQRAIQRLFEAAAFNVRVASDGVSGLKAFVKHSPDAVLLDLRLPRMSGSELCRRFKMLSPDIPVVVVSANCSQDDKATLFALGADDYVTKPFSGGDLLARVQRLLTAQAVAASSSRDTLYRFSDVTVDIATKRAHRDGQPVDLTVYEFRLLRYFLEHANCGITRDVLMERVWSDRSHLPPKLVDWYIRRLRDKLEPDPSRPRHILTLEEGNYTFVFDSQPNPGDH
jgi:DNA-binding response OmpR family regulator